MHLTLSSPSSPLVQLGHILDLFKRVVFALISECLFLVIRYFARETPWGKEDQIRNLAVGPRDLSLAVEVYVRSLLSWLTNATRPREAMVVRMIWIFRNQASSSQSLQLLLCKYPDAIPGQFCRRTDLQTNIQMTISCKNTWVNYYELLLLHLQQLSHWS